MNWYDMENTKYKIPPQNILSNSEKILKIDHSPLYYSLVIPHKFYLGKYTLSAEINFGEGSQVLYANTSFLALPYNILLLIIILAIILTISFYIKKKLT